MSGGRTTTAVQLEAQTQSGYAGLSQYVDKVTTDRKTSALTLQSLVAKSYQYGREWLRTAVVRKLGSKGKQVGLGRI